MVRNIPIFSYQNLIASSNINQDWTRKRRKKLFSLITLTILHVDIRSSYGTSSCHFSMITNLDLFNDILIFLVALGSL